MYENDCKTTLIEQWMIHIFEQVCFGFKFIRNIVFHISHPIKSQIKLS
jgi:hypothetical protein